MKGGLIFWGRGAEVKLVVNKCVVGVMEEEEEAVFIRGVGCCKCGVGVMGANGETDRV